MQETANASVNNTDFAQYRLRGSRGSRYTVEARVESKTDALITLTLRDGRHLRVPIGAIEGIIERDTAPLVERRSGSDGAYISVLRELERLTSAWENYVSLSANPTQIAEPLADRAESFRGVLDELNQVLLSERQSAMIEKIDMATEALISRLREPDWERAKQAREVYLSALRGIRPQRQGSKLSRVLYKSVRLLKVAESEDWKAFSAKFAAHPHIESSAEEILVAVDSRGEFDLPLRVVLKGAIAPAKNIQVVLDQFRNIEIVGQPPVLPTLQPGATHTVRVKMLERRRQGANSDVRVRAHLNYSGPNNEALTSAAQKFILKLEKKREFTRIENPFRDYASGIPVDDPKMFYGREELIEDIVTHLTVRPVGRCYGLYGQKRSGKSSVSGQVKARIDATDAIVCSLSMGTIDRNAITSSFVSEVLDQLREQLGRRLTPDTFKNLLTRWPDARELELSPLASLRKASVATRALLRRDDQPEPRLVLIVDEFTYLYELLRRDHVSEGDQHQLRDFMRQWKGWVEAKLFSALVIGQDTMPAFLSAFANEFSVMHTERLDYLSEPETVSLADSPVQRPDGTSRFGGFALSNIYQYTGGHPYFTQILCDRVVSIANEQHRTDITDLEVDTAVETLISGTREIGVHRFDCLLSADNAGVLLDETHGESNIDSLNVARRVLQKMALVGGRQNKHVARDSLDLSHSESLVFDDLCQRNVLTSREGLFQIRVLLFSEYLRRSEL